VPTSQGRRPRGKLGKRRHFDASHSDRAQAERDKQARLALRRRELEAAAPPAPASETAGLTPAS
jgi:hypothetical protein